MPKRSWVPFHQIPIILTKAFSSDLGYLTALYSLELERLNKIRSHVARGIQNHKLAVYGIKKAVSLLRVLSVSSLVNDC